MADGIGCKCAAHSESQCGCGVDWTPKELIEARAELTRLRKELSDVIDEAYALRIAVAELDAKNEQLSGMVYETGPGEYSPDGWTYKQAFEAEVKRRKEAEHALEEVAEIRTELAEAQRHAKVLAEKIPHNYRAVLVAGTPIFDAMLYVKGLP